ncbi:hypothetical protein Mterra_03796 [Calidithermus terrae]|uniref:Uncharacterized protein n=1 Tax=Calidithermus terrae TaxID=1408545 RepID=A0A399DY83_9DEIN|nr:hypothetical protein Mterra_03796 [Calidithermus terrae]
MALGAVVAGGGGDEGVLLQGEGQQHPQGLDGLGAAQAVVKHQRAQGPEVAAAARDPRQGPAGPPDEVAGPAQAPLVADPHRQDPGPGGQSGPLARDQGRDGRAVQGAAVAGDLAGVGVVAHEVEAGEKPRAEVVEHPVGDAGVEHRHGDAGARAALEPGPPADGLAVVRGGLREGGRVGPAGAVAVVNGQHEVVLGDAGDGLVEADAVHFQQRERPLAGAELGGHGEAVPGRRHRLAPPERLRRHGPAERLPLDPLVELVRRGPAFAEGVERAVELEHPRPDALPLEADEQPGQVAGRRRGLEQHRDGRLGP